MTFSEWKNIVKETFRDFAKERPLLHGAALSYYALLALIPLLYLSLTSFGHFVGHETMMDIITSLLKEQIGLKDVSGITEYLNELDLSKGSVLTEILGIFALMISCTAILNSLKKSLNELYGLERQKLKAKTLIVRGVLFRLISMVFIVGAAVLVIGLYFAETVFLSFGNRFFEGREVITWFFSETAQHGIPIIMNLILFSFVFKYLNDGVVKWRNAIVGGAVTSVLLYLGQLLIKYYLMNYFFAANGGVAGTMLIILVWVFYSSQILFLGAKFTKVYSKYKGTPITYR